MKNAGRFFNGPAFFLLRQRSMAWPVDPANQRRGERIHYNSVSSHTRFTAINPMRRPAKNRSRRLTPDSQRLVSLSRAMVQSGSRLEERAWERHLDVLLRKLLRGDHQAALDAALDHLFTVDQFAYDALMESVEALSSSCSIEHEGQPHDALLIAMPILAWTRFSIPAGPVSAESIATIGAHLHGHVLADNARLAIAPTLYAIDQLPRSHADIAALTQRMAQSALTGTPLRPLGNPPETAPFLADSRYLLAAVVVPAQAPLFRWQTGEDMQDIAAAEERAAQQWRTQASPNLERLLPGCGVELLLPEAYYTACREADRAIRPISLHAAVNYLTNALAVSPTDLTAIIGRFSEDVEDDQIDEYRISFALRSDPQVVYGVVWPLYGSEDGEEDTQAAGAATRALLPTDEEAPVAPIVEIIAMLKQCGIEHIRQHAEEFAMESCDDCGAPLFCDLEAELVHAEMPEDSPGASVHLH
jgi:hypothetical protein